MIGTLKVVRILNISSHRNDGGWIIVQHKKGLDYIHGYICTLKEWLEGVYEF